MFRDFPGKSCNLWRAKLCFHFLGGRREEAAQQYINQVYSSELRLASQVGSIERA